MHKRRTGSGRGRFAVSALGEAGPCGAPPSGVHNSPLRVCLHSSKKQQCCCSVELFSSVQLSKTAHKARCTERSDCMAWRERAKAVRNAEGKAISSSRIPHRVCQGPTQPGAADVKGTGAAG